MQNWPGRLKNQGQGTSEIFEKLNEDQIAHAHSYL